MLGNPTLQRPFSSLLRSLPSITVRPTASSISGRLLCTSRSSNSYNDNNNHSNSFYFSHRSCCVTNLSQIHSATVVQRLNSLYTCRYYTTDAAEVQDLSTTEMSQKKRGRKKTRSETEPADISDKSEIIAVDSYTQSETQIPDNSIKSGLVPLNDTNGKTGNKLSKAASTNAGSLPVRHTPTWVKERRKNIKAQKQLFKSVDIFGIDHFISDEQLPTEVLNLLQGIDAPIEIEDIESTHRATWSTQGLVVCRFKEVNQVYRVLECSRKLKSRVQSGNHAVFIQPSMSERVRHLRYDFIVPLIKEGKLANVRMGDKWCNQIRLRKGEEWIDIAHVKDLVDLGLVEKRGDVY